MTLLKGAEAAARMIESMKAELENWQGAIPKLAIVRVGENPDDISYERGAVKRMEKIGLESVCYSFPGDISHEGFEEEFVKINQDPDIHGILLLRPLPKQIREDAILRLIDPKKDLDGICPENMAKLYMGEEDCFAPCTAEAVVALLDHAGIDLTGKNVVVVGRSLVIGKPAAQLLIRRNATVTVVHTKTKQPEQICHQADILVVAAGKAKLVGAEYVREGAVVIDVGIHYDEASGKMCGDVDFESAKEKASLITPVPGGVGAVTTTILAAHLIRAARMQRQQEKTQV